MRKVIKFLNKSDIVSVLIPIVILAVILCSVSDGFLSAYNLQSLGRTIGVVLVIGFAQMFTLSLGHFNLAAGSMAGFAAVSVSAMMQVYNVNIWVAIICGIGMGAILGFLQGFLIVKTGINPFIISLSLASVYLGLIIGLTRSTIYEKLPGSFLGVGSMNLAGIPLLFIISLIISVVIYFVIEKTLFGRQVLATGVNKRAAAFSGIQVNRLILAAHILSGVLAAIAGIMQVIKIGVGQSSIGSDWLMISFAIPVLGGTSLSGGKVNAFGAIFGAILMTLITNTLILLNVNQYWYQTFTGLILLAAFEFDRLRVSARASRAS